MSGTAWAALVVTAVSGLTAALTWRTWRRDRMILSAFLIGLPLSFLTNRFVKTPILLAVERIAWPDAPGIPPWSFLLVSLWVAPVVEEAAKLLPLVLPDVRARLVHQELPFRVGMASGFGFGLGEAWYVAWSISLTPVFSSLPFLSLTGYISERLVIAFSHAVMTSVAVLGFAGRPSPASGYALAVILHAFLNLGPLAYQIGLIGNPVRNLLNISSIAVLSVVFERLRRTVYV